MIQGLTLQQLSQTLAVQHNAKRDYLLDTRALQFVPEGTNGALHFRAPDGDAVLAVTEHALKQVGESCEIPWSYMLHMREHSKELLAKNVNHWFAATGKQQLIRTFRGLATQDVARAFLSNRYRPLDNYDLADAVLPMLTCDGIEVKSCEITETRLYLQAVTSRVTGEVKPGDVVQAGVVISNSETGDGALQIRPMIYRLVCTNGLISGFALRQNHIGRRHAQIKGDYQEAQEFFSDETREADDRALWFKVRDTVKAALNEVLFQKLVAKLQLATQVDLGEHIETVAQVVTERFHLSEFERGGFLAHLAQGRDVSQYGVVNAITRLAQDAPNYDRAIELERSGGVALELRRQDFLRLN